MKTALNLKLDPKLCTIRVRGISIHKFLNGIYCFCIKYMKINKKYYIVQRNVYFQLG